jgi:ATP-dependent DNA helicase RecQ
MSLLHNESPGTADRDLREVMRRYWGFDSFLPLQAEAMDCVLEGRDSVVVLPTGGGKSLCFQAPAMCLDGLAVVVSPLISLMKDQVDALRNCGVPAAFSNSTLSARERRDVTDDVRAGRVRLLYLAPERLLTEGTLEFLKTTRVSLIAIDEAHCISAWGHDFRPEYRGLGTLKKVFPQVGVHAYTATASETVRQDIAQQLKLSGAEILVGSFDRPNLVYKVQRRSSRMKQIREVLDRHPRESGIVYCIARKEVDQTAAALAELGYRAIPYHAGMTDDDRRRNQERFLEEQADTIVATVAFGMGIDKPNVRYVIHAGMPKSLESYQQESGRAGRDGLDAECCLFYSGQDYGIWKRIVEESEPTARKGALRSLSAMYDFCTGVQCRHRAIVEYFGQRLKDGPCGACDVCLGQLDLVDDPLVVGQKILSCVVRLRERFGGDYTAKVLLGSQEQRILQMGHNYLSTYGLLSNETLRTIRDWIEQLVTQDFLEKVGEYNVLRVTTGGRELLRGEQTPRLLRPTKPAKAAKPKAVADSWDGVDRGLFDDLRQLRREQATAENVPAYIVFGDAALRDMARRRPTTPAGFRLVKGVGEKKLANYGDQFIERIIAYCHANGLPTDVTPG